jgi:hypothetical protein
MNLLRTLGLILLIGMAIPASANEPISADLNTIVTAIKSGNAKSLAASFDKQVEITVMNKEGAYSKSQAELIVKDFFAGHVPVSFSIIHEGSSGGNSKYGIGTLKTNNGTFRTYIYLKKIGETWAIQQLRFEEE